MRAHPESVRDRLELLGLLVNASALPPEPRLMHEGPVRRVHQSDDPVVNMRRQLARKMRDLVFVAEYRKRGRRRYRLRQVRPRAIHINPNIPVSLFAGIMPRKDPLHFQLVLAGERWNLHALPAARIEPPPVVAALHHFAVEPSVRQRYSAMRAGIAHRRSRIVVYRLQLLRTLGWSRSKAPDKPTQREEHGTTQKHRNARRVNPGVVDILAGIQKRPENERADAEILNDLSSLVGRDGRLLRLEASERSASSNELRPSPSDDLRRRKIPFRR